jgi:hypothetical protein
MLVGSKGKFIASGCFRDVYAYGRGKVIKIEKEYVPCLVTGDAIRRVTRSGGPNEREWIVWNRVKDTPLAPYFAEVYEITPEGHIVMARAKRDCHRNTCGGYGESRFDDLAMVLDIYDGYAENVGLFGKQLKLIDYPTIDLRRIPSGIKLVRSWHVEN